jgi:hypothetical protein
MRPADATNLSAKRGAEIIEVQMLAHKSCDGASGYLLFVVRDGQAWRVLDQRRAWKTIDD